MLMVRLQSMHVIVLSVQQPEEEIFNTDADGADNITAAAKEDKVNVKSYGFFPFRRR